MFLKKINCVIFDFGFTLSSDFYFKVCPPEIPDWFELAQEHLFQNSDLFDLWMIGKKTVEDMGHFMSELTGLDQRTAVYYLREGAKSIKMNPTVWDFAMDVRLAGMKTAIVTGNIDLFTEIIVPEHQMDQKFDVIINSFDYQELDKSILWPKVFMQLGTGYEYSTSLLVEDSQENVSLFEILGGLTHHYTNDEGFLKWMKKQGNV